MGIDVSKALTCTLSLIFEQSNFDLYRVTVSAFPRAGNAPLVTAHARY